MVIHKIMDLQTHPEPYVTTSDLADYWRVSRKQIYKQIEAGTLKAIRLGPRLLRIGTADAIRFEEIARMSPPSACETPSHRGNGGVVATAADRPSSPTEAGRNRRTPRK
jgi:excisionase family DNA binding protein